MNFLRYFSILSLIPGCCSAEGFIIEAGRVSPTISFTCAMLFMLGYGFVIFEETLHLKKSKSMLLAGSMIWVLLGVSMHGFDQHAALEASFKHVLLDYAELLLFLIVAMTYVSSMIERNLFEKLRAYLIEKGLTYRQLFWITGTLAFFISPIADNLTTALLMGAVVGSLGKNNKKFVTLSCINIVVAANAGGAFSPFGDITTLMVWQKGFVEFFTFFKLFIPSLINYFVPAVFMSFSLTQERPQAIQEKVNLKKGAWMMLFLFLLTIATAVGSQHFLGLPPVFGMITGLSYLMMYSYYLKVSSHHSSHGPQEGSQFDIFEQIRECEWDTLLFFYGVMLAVGGLGFLGYLHLLSTYLYGSLGESLPVIYQHTPGNILIGIVSAILDNIPIMFSVLTMNPSMSTGQWLLVTLTAGVGGSLLSIGSAAGVALMGQNPSKYTFFDHLKWLPAIFLGYIASIGAHIVLNQHLF